MATQKGLSIARSKTAEPTFACEESLRPYMHVQGHDLHNTWQGGNAFAQARQEAAQAMSESQAGIIGSFVKDKYPRWQSGFTSNREFLVRLHRQTIFAQEAVKPYQKASLYDIKGESWDTYLGASSHGRRAPTATQRPPQLAATAASLDLSMSESRQRIPFPRNMKPQDRVKALDWVNFGKRNHKTILWKQPYSTQYSAAALPIASPGWSLRPETTTPDRWTRRQDILSSPNTAARPQTDEIDDNAPNFRTHVLPEASTFGIRPSTEVGMRRSPLPSRYRSNAFPTPPTSSQFMQVGEFDSPGRASPKNLHVGRLKSPLS